MRNPRDSIETRDVFLQIAGHISVVLLGDEGRPDPGALDNVLRLIGEHYEADAVSLYWSDEEESAPDPGAQWRRDARVDADGLADIRADFQDRDSTDGTLIVGREAPHTWATPVRSEVAFLGNIIGGAFRAARQRRKLETSETRFRDIVENTEDLIWESDLELNTTYTNRAFEGGLTRAESMHPDDLRLMRDLLPEKIINRDGWHRRLIRVRRTDGTYRFVESSATPVFDTRGEMRGFRGVDRDVSGEYFAAGEIQGYERKIGSLLNAIRDGALFLEGDRIVDCNEAATSIFRLPRREIIGKRPWDISPEYQDDGTSSEDAGRRHVQDAIERGFTRFEWKHSAGDGRDLFTEVSIACIETRDGQQVIGVVRDLTDVHNANAALSRREADLRHSQEVAGVGSIRFTARANEDGTVDWKELWVSDQILALFDMERSETLGQDLVSRTHPDDREKLTRAIQDLASGRAGTENEYRILRPDGSRRIIQSVNQFVDIDDDGYVSVLGTLKDVTQWVDANSRLHAALRQIEMYKDQLQEENLYLRDEVRAAHGLEHIVGESEALRKVLASVEQVAPTNVTVLVTGETGTGKELIAQSIHDLSDRKDMPMVSVNCAALSPDLIESELFGHEKGAFTGAHEQRKGRFELANGGTLFLDEIAEISPVLQAKLLRVLQEGEFERLGGTSTLRADVRLVTATNRDLKKEVDAGRFRADLYYRINSFPIHVPPLRERKSDIPLLAEHFVRRHARKLGKSIRSISRESLRYLNARDWPGNVRELEGTILRALISATSPVLELGGDRNGADPAAEGKASVQTLEDAQRAHIMSALTSTGWVIEGKQGAAAELGLAPSSLRSRMKRLGIRRPD
ncbi:MAG: sigma 54-interacting transcriptional regulator [Woeseiaceae bacterium]|nr:sigma 54-interacting transcriptional regulator [Woeseiaceae bacterium]